MQEDVLRIAIVTNVIPSYRRGFYSRLFARQDIGVDVYCQEDIRGVSVATVHEEFKDRVQVVRYAAWSGEKLVWQYLPWARLARNYDVVFVVGNPRVLSDVALGTYLVLKRQPVVVWTSATSFRSVSWRERMRLAWTRIFSHILLYTDAEVKYLLDRGFKGRTLVGMNNGLDQKAIENAAAKWPARRLAEWRSIHGLANSVVFLSCSRLNRKNQYGLGLDAFAAAVREDPRLHWIIIGSGEDERFLKQRISTLGLERKVTLTGEILEEENLAPYFLSARAFLHPAAIGLSLLHAFGYGVPVILDDEPRLHGPEIAAFTKGVTGYCFKHADSDSLAAVILGAAREPAECARMGSRALQIAQTEFNVDIMVDRFVEIAKAAFRDRARKGKVSSPDTRTRVHG